MSFNECQNNQWGKLMAVESRFVVMRNGVEAKTFMDKKSADEYDRMLDMADNLSQMFTQSSVVLSDSVNEELSIFLAEHREEVLVALLAKKPTKITMTETAEKSTDITEGKSVAKVKNNKATPTKLSEAS